MMARRARRETATAARNRLLPEGRVAGPMPWVIAIMIFLTILSAAAGLGLAEGARVLRTELAARATVQIVDADREVRQATANRILAGLRGLPGVRSATPIDEAVLASQLRPWLGADMDAADIPIPALIDISFSGNAGAALAAATARVRAIAPAARIEPHAAFLGPLAGLVGTLTLIAALAVVLMAFATGAVVVLAARGAHESHRGTIEILHLMGSTDVQIARLFQRRIALDALFGGALGFVLAVIVILIVGQRLGTTGSDLLQAISLPPIAWLLLLAVPLGGTLLATLTARMTVLRALGRTL